MALVCLLKFGLSKLFVFARFWVKLSRFNFFVGIDSVLAGHVKGSCDFVYKFYQYPVAFFSHYQMRNKLLTQA